MKIVTFNLRCVYDGEKTVCHYPVAVEVEI